MGFGLSYAAGEGADALQSIIKQKLLEQVQKHQMMMAEQKLAEDARQADMNEQIQRGKLDIDRDQVGIQRGRLTLDNQRLTEDARQFDALGPDRTATRNYHIAQTTELGRRPQAEEATRAHELALEDKRSANDIAQIRERNAGDERVEYIRLRPRVEKVDGLDANGKPVTKVIDMDSRTVVMEVPKGLPANQDPAKVKELTLAREQAKKEVRGDKPSVLSAIGSMIFGSGEKKPTTVRLRAPNGQEMDVPADQAQHYIAKGAKQVQ